MITRLVVDNRLELICRVAALLKKQRAFNRLTDFLVMISELLRFIILYDSILRTSTFKIEKTMQHAYTNNKIYPLLYEKTLIIEKPRFKKNKMNLPSIE